MLKKLIVTNVTCHKCHILSQPKSVRSQLLQCKTNCSFVCLFAIMFVLTQRRRERRVPTENYVSRRTVFVPLIMIFCPAEPTVGALGEAKWQKWQKFFRYSVIFPFLPL